MTRITKWLFPEDMMVIKHKKISTRVWCQNQCEEIERKTNDKCSIEEDRNGKIAIYRNLNGEK